MDSTQRLGGPHVAVQFAAEGQGNDEVPVDAWVWHSRLRLHRRCLSCGPTVIGLLIVIGEVASLERLRIGRLSGRLAN